MTIMARMQSGFTLLEVLLASGIFAVVATLALSFSATATKQAEINTNIANTLVGQVNALDKMREELSVSATAYTGEDEFGTAVADTILIGTNSVQFRKVIGYNPGTFQTIWSSFITYRLAAAPGETLGNSLDDNFDGNKDEMCLKRFQAEEEAFLTTDLCFESAAKFEVKQDVTFPSLITITLLYMTTEASEEIISRRVALFF